jgi:hypothetical protein
MTEAESQIAPVDSFRSGALSRITCMIPILCLLVVPLSLWRSGWRGAVGWLLGSLVAYLSFRSLISAVDGLGERIAVGGKRERGGAIVVKFLLRYGLFAFAAYVIVNYSVGGLHWALAGLFLPVAASMCEAAYELCVTLRRGT